MNGEEAPDWRAIERAYAARDLSVRTICERHGISEASLRRRAKAEGWPSRRAAKQVSRTDRQIPAARVPEPSAAVTSAERRARMITQLYRIVEDKVQMILERGSQGSEDQAQTPVESERDARTLSSLIRTFDKLCSIDDRSRAADAQSGMEAGSAYDDAERLRRDLANRLARLRAAGNP